MKYVETIGLNEIRSQILEMYELKPSDSNYFPDSYCKITRTMSLRRMSETVQH
jgi:hypothetical protein